MVEFGVRPVPRAMVLGNVHHDGKTLFSTYWD